MGFSPCPSLPPMKLCSEFSVGKNKLLTFSTAKDALNFAKNCFGVCNWHTKMSIFLISIWPIILIHKLYHSVNGH